MRKQGIIIIYVLVFGTVFLVLLFGLLGFILLQLRYSAQKIAWNEALQIAEAGLNYYRWCINNEVEPNCQTEKNYYDSAGNLIGYFSLNIVSDIVCGQTIQKRVISTGWENRYPDLKRKLSTIYARESVAKYSYLLNSNTWVGEDHFIRGPYHSNGGVRFDGQNQSIVSSAKENWICTSSFGCGPRGLPGRGVGLGNCPISPGGQCQVVNQQCLCPGVFTDTYNPNEDLFSFPVPPFDFNAITIDLAQIKNITINYPQEKYWPPSNQIDSGGKGYHLKFKETGEIEVWIIAELSPSYAYSLEEGWHYNYFTITNEYLYKTITIDSACPLYFFEDNLWPEGKIKGRLTIVSANLIDPIKDSDVVLPASIDYSILDGLSALTLISERNILIGPQSPQIMILRGIFVAQKGRFSRNHYFRNIREKLEVYGSIISNGRVGTKWVSGSQIVSGYLKRETYVDSNLIFNPPIFTPFLSSQYKIFDWKEL